VREIVWEQRSYEIPVVATGGYGSVQHIKKLGGVESRPEDF
jgi:hypothetical protein